MAKQLDSKELVSFKEMLLTEVITSEAIINLMEEMKQVQASMNKGEK